MKPVSLLLRLALTVLAVLALARLLIGRQANL